MFNFLRSNSIGKNLLVLALAHYVVDFFVGIWPIYKTISGLDIAKAGLIAGISGFIGEGLQIVFGYFSDKGLRKYILLLGVLLSSSIAWVTCSENFFFYFVLLLLLNIGSGSFHPAAVGYAGSLTSEHKSKTILLFAAAGLAGFACSQMVFTNLIALGKFSSLFLLLPTFAILAWVSRHGFPKKNETPMSSIRDVIDQFKRVKKTLSLLYFGQLFSYGLVLSLIFLLPDILAVKTTNTWLKMGGGHFCFILGGICSLCFMGALCDKHGQRAMLLLANVASILFFSLLTFSPTIEGIFGTMLLFLLGASLNSINPMIVSWGHKIVPASPSCVSGLLMGLAWCFSHLCPALSGALYKMFPLHPETYTLASIGGLLFLSLGCIWLIPTKEAAVQTS